jgi:hypothetical protein
LEHLQEGFRVFTRTIEHSMPQFPSEEGLHHLAAIVEQHERSAPQSQVAPGPKPTRILYDRLLAELSIYIGRHTAIRLLDRCNHDLLQREGFSQIVEPVVTAFLGKHAGAAVLANVLRIWDRTHQVPS